MQTYNYQTYSIFLRPLLSVLVLIFSLLIDTSLFFLALCFEIIILIFPLYFQNIFLFFRLTSLLLYYSYFLESGTYYTYGGDDYGFATRFIQNTDWIDFNILMSGDIINYPLFYYINKLFYNIFLTNVNFDIISIHLVAINNFILTLAFIFYRKISLNLFKKDYSLYLLLLTPVIYFGSIHIRDVYNFFFYALAFYLLISKNKYNVQIIFLCFILSFFIRPETSIVFLFIILLIDKNNFYKYLSISISILIAYLYLPYIIGLFRDFDQLSQIYDQAGLGLSSESGLGESLRNSDSIVSQVFWYLYNFYRPIPPYLVVQYSFENLFNFFGNIIWYVCISSIFLNIDKVINNRFLRFNIIFFFIYVFAVSFFGGTQRHFMMFIPIVFLHFIHLNYNFEKKTVLIFIGIFFALLLYIFLKL